MTVRSQPIDLAVAGASIVRRLGGQWHDHWGMCLCPAHDDRTPSLSVRVGERSLLFKCFAGCRTLDVLTALRRARLTVPTGDTRGIVGRSASTTSRQAEAIWTESRPLMETPAQLYLRRRGIATMSDALRFHPRTPLGRGRCVQFRPALIAAVREARALVAVQRIFLDLRTGATAADLANPKRMLGRPMSGAVRLFPAGSVLGLAEGLETAMSASILLRIPVWAALGNERFAHVEFPPHVSRLILLPDNDAGGRHGERVARTMHVRHGLTLETIWPSGGLNDWNDVLRAGGKWGEGRVRQAA